MMEGMWLLLLAVVGALVVGVVVAVVVLLIVKRGGREDRDEIDRPRHGDHGDKERRP